ncbi:hypothetical protein G6F57_022318 [Rhizopus arrhizus]|nr:hypothetical protein G6F57_022318 [Rhizopus arrhizus]
MDANSREEAESIGAKVMFVDSWDASKLDSHLHQLAIDVISTTAVVKIQKRTDHITNSTPSIQYANRIKTFTSYPDGGTECIKSETVLLE